MRLCRLALCAAAFWVWAPLAAQSETIRVHGTITNLPYPDKATNPTVRVSVYEDDNQLDRSEDAEFDPRQNSFEAKFLPTAFDQRRFVIAIADPSYTIIHPKPPITFFVNTHNKYDYQYDLTITHKANLIQDLIVDTNKSLNNNRPDIAQDKITLAITLTRSLSSDSDATRRANFSVILYKLVASLFEYYSDSQHSPPPIDALYYFRGESLSSPFILLPSAIRQNIYDRIITSLYRNRQQIYTLGSGALPYDSELLVLYNASLSSDNNDYSVTQAAYLYFAGEDKLDISMAIIYKFLLGADKQSMNGVVVPFIRDWTHFITNYYSYSEYNEWLNSGTIDNVLLLSNLSQLCEVVKKYNREIKYTRSGHNLDDLLQACSKVTS